MQFWGTLGSKHEYGEVSGPKCKFNKVYEPKCKMKKKGGISTIGEPFMCVGQNVYEDLNPKKILRVYLDTVYC